MAYTALAYPYWASFHDAYGCLRQAIDTMGITLFTLIYDPINGKPDIIVLYQARDNTYAQISAHTGCFLEHLRLYLWVMSILLMYIRISYTVVTFLHVICIICDSCWWLAYLLLVVRPAFPWLWVSTLNRLSLLCTPSSAKLVIVQCCKLIVICRLSLFVVINNNYSLSIICSRYINLDQLPLY